MVSPKTLLYALADVMFTLFHLFAFSNLLSSSADLPVTSPKTNVRVALANASDPGTKCLSYNSRKDIFHLMCWNTRDTAPGSGAHTGVSHLPSKPKIRR